MKVGRETVLYSVNDYEVLKTSIKDSMEHMKNNLVLDEEKYLHLLGLSKRFIECEAKNSKLNETNKNIEG